MGKVYLIITCCIDSKIGVKWTGRRRQEYFLGISNILEHCREKDIIPIIVENSKDGSSYLDVFNCDKVYTKNNEFEVEGDFILHKGVNELRDINFVIKKYNIQNDDMIIKHTGRYMLFQDDFFKLVLDNLDKECIQKTYNVCTYSNNEIDIVMGLFAIKARYLKVFKYTGMDDNMGCEEDFKRYILSHIKKEDIVEVDKLYLRVCLGDNHKFIDV
jgi:hypothetical protein